MKDSTFITLAIGMIIGAIGVSMSKPAQHVVKKGTEVVKDKTKDLLEKIKCED